MTVRIIQGDCLEVMRSMPDNSIDLICTDPPYHKMKQEKWDRQWDSDESFLHWIGLLCEQWQRLLKPNGSLYCFASPRMSARVEVAIAQRFNVLNNIRWDKSNLPGGGRHKKACKESLRSYFPAYESIIFAEHFGADNAAKGLSGYDRECNKLRGFIFEPLRAYLDGERRRAGIKPLQIMEWFALKGYPKYVTARHSFSQSQWELPTAENYERLRRCFAELGFPGSLQRPYEELRQQYEELRQQYEELRQQYEELRRPFFVTDAVPYTDTWAFPTVQSYKGKHVCAKPLAMMEHMIAASTRGGGVVLDCFAGSGSTLIAAKRLGREFVGIEIDPHWVEAATRSLDAIAPNVVPFTKKTAIAPAPQPAKINQLKLFG